MTEPRNCCSCRQLFGPSNQSQAFSRQGPYGPDLQNRSDFFCKNKMLRRDSDSWSVQTKRLGHEWTSQRFPCSLVDYCNILQLLGHGWPWSIITKHQKPLMKHYRSPLTLLNMAIWILLVHKSLHWCWLMPSRTAPSGEGGFWERVVLKTNSWSRDMSQNVGYDMKNNSNVGLWWIVMFIHFVSCCVIFDPMSMEPGTFARGCSPPMCCGCCCIVQLAIVVDVVELLESR